MEALITALVGLSYVAKERFFECGDFYGINEEIIVHALPKEGAFVVNMFNLSDQTRTISGRNRTEEDGPRPDAELRCQRLRRRIENGVYYASCAMAPLAGELYRSEPREAMSILTLDSRFYAALPERLRPSIRTASELDWGCHLRPFAWQEPARLWISGGVK